MMHGFSTLGRKRSSQNKWRTSGEQRFLGEGQTFKGKFIGVLEVPEARGDRMCQDALAELKTAIKASGEHKQRVIMHIAVDGLKIRDEKTGDCLYHHPVHKISFIAQDMADNRAFGYIYGSPDNGHRFFGIKTEKAAGQVVVAMRDLFQVVFEIKKKEIEAAKNQLMKDRGNLESHLQSAAPFPKDNGPDVLASALASSGPTTGSQQQLQAQQHYQAVMGGGTVAAPPAQQLQNEAAAAALPPAAAGGGGMNDLLGLEHELSSIQAGLQQIDKMTPLDNQQPGDAFAAVLQQQQQQAAFLQQQQQQAAMTQAAAAGGNKPKPQAIMSTGPVRNDAFGAAPFLPPPPKNNKPQHPQAFGVPPPVDAFAAFGAQSSFPPPTSSMDSGVFPPASFGGAPAPTSLVQSGMPQPQQVGYPPHIGTSGISTSANGGQKTTTTTASASNAFSSFAEIDPLGNRAPRDFKAVSSAAALQKGPTLAELAATKTEALPSLNIGADQGNNNMLDGLL